MKNNIALISLIVAVVAGSLGFFGGMKYQQGQRGAFRQFGGQFGAGITGTNGGRGQNMMGRGNGFRPVSGQIISQDKNSITVKMGDGSSRIVILSDKTEINKAEKASAADLKTGDTVAVFGTTNNDGSVTAQTVQINPVFRAGQEATPTQ